MKKKQYKIEVMFNLLTGGQIGTCVVVSDIDITKLDFDKYIERIIAESIQRSVDRLLIIGATKIIDDNKRD